MEGPKRNTSSPSASPRSSIAVELFGPRDTLPASSQQSSTDFFGSVFGPRSTGRGLETGNAKYTPDGSTDSGVSNVQPWNYNSSIYYGGQEVYSTSSSFESEREKHKKDGQDDDSNGSHSQGAASRGNWWQGSLYY